MLRWIIRPRLDSPGNVPWMIIDGKGEWKNIV